MYLNFFQNGLNLITRTINEKKNIYVKAGVKKYAHIINQIYNNFIQITLIYFSIFFFHNLMCIKVKLRYIYIYMFHRTL